MRFNFAVALALGAAVPPATFASAIPVKANPFDVEAIQNKVRCGAIAIANREQPYDEHNKKANFRNGDVVDTKVIEDPENQLRRRQEETDATCDGEISSCEDQINQLYGNAEQYTGEVDYQCNARCDGLQFDALNGMTCGRILGYYEAEPVSNSL